MTYEQRSANCRTLAGGATLWARFGPESPRVISTQKVFHSLGRRMLVMLRNGDAAMYRSSHDARKRLYRILRA
jgi:hypothetical protein